ncbi:hypothetical protein AV530_004336 [Patagioenas fasciata monilis]|uniref:Uncharacterized protein n=1 Tax=Patagioenas fasciata monilis TaxID=372326 RepID=A0A1V4KAP3_PATFA|nr:hypothetical protein AV530_004336 [Patagioenas fasciata monilis]
MVSCKMVFHAKKGKRVFLPSPLSFCFSLISRNRSFHLLQGCVARRYPTDVLSSVEGCNPAPDEEPHVQVAATRQQGTDPNPNVKFGPIRQKHHCMVNPVF